MRSPADPDLAECLRLQGFPDDYFDGLGFSDSSKYKMIGNSVAVPCVEWIARRMTQHFRSKTPVYRETPFKGRVHGPLELKTVKVKY